MKSLAVPTTHTDAPNPRRGSSTSSRWKMLDELEPSSRMSKFSKQPLEEVGTIGKRQPLNGDGFFTVWTCAGSTATHQSAPHLSSCHLHDARKCRLIISGTLWDAFFVVWRKLLSANGTGGWRDQNGRRGEALVARPVPARLGFRRHEANYGACARGGRQRARRSAACLVLSVSFWSRVSWLKMKFAVRIYQWYLRWSEYASDSLR